MTKFTLCTWSLLLWLLAGLAPAGAQRLAAGNNHTLSIHADGTLWAWGANYYGQLGSGGSLSQPTPVQVGTAATWQSVVAGGDYTVAIRTDGTLWAWGNNSAGQLGIGTDIFQATPVQVGTATTWRSVSAGNAHTLATRTDGTLWAWGNNTSGQLGDGSTSNRYTPVQVGTATTWCSVSAGSDHTLALRTDGTLWAWGSNTYGQLGNGTVSNQLTPGQVGTATTWPRRGGGSPLMIVAIRTDGTLWAWGDNFYGQLGLGTTTFQAAPVQVGTSRTWQAVAAGGQHTVALRTDNGVWAWGSNTLGQLGNGVLYQRTPVSVAPNDTWRSISAGGENTLAIRTDGTLWGWGFNGSRQISNQTTPNFNLYTPTQSSAATDWQLVSASTNFTEAIRTDGTLWAAGSNAYGQLGVVPSYVSTFNQVGTAAWRSVATGQSHTIAVRQDGTLWAWGLNDKGQLGLGTTSTTPQATPVQVGTATNWQSVAAGLSSTMAIRQDGTLWAWGDNPAGLLGLGTRNGTQPSPVQVGTATNWQSVALGYYHAVAIRTDGTLWTWGDNYAGQLGLGSITTQATPQQVGTGTTWQSTAVSASHSAAIKTDGTLWTWGDNYYGQLGLGNIISQATPRQVGTGTTWQRVSTGWKHMVALRTDGSLWTWGDNAEGQLAQSPANPLPIFIPNPTPLAATPGGRAAAWQLMPNPARGQAQLVGLPAGPVAAQLFDTQGRLVRTTTAATVELTGLAPGLYLLRATAGGTTRTLRLAVE